MNYADFTMIKHFNVSEIKRANGDLDSLPFEIIQTLDRLRTLTGSPIHIVFNGLNSGFHSTNSLHYKGLAVDVVTKCDPIKFMLYACSVGFTDFGYYLNKAGVVSFHLGLGTQGKIKTWSATKKSDYEWDYKGLELL